MVKSQYENLVIQTTPLLGCSLPEGKSPWDKDGIFTFTQTYNRFYKDDIKPSYIPCLGKWSTQKPQLTPLGRINIIERSILVSKKILTILTAFKLAPHILFSIPYEITYEINSQWDETGEYYLLFFYTSLFNKINWQNSTFFQHVHTEEDIIFSKDLKFESSDRFTQVYPSELIEKGYDFTPQDLFLDIEPYTYDLFGLFYIDNNLIISEACAAALRKAKAYSMYNKTEPLRFNIIHS